LHRNDVVEAYTSLLRCGLAVQSEAVEYHMSARDDGDNYEVVVDLYIEYQRYGVTVPLVLELERSAKDNPRIQQKLKAYTRIAELSDEADYPHGFPKMLWLARTDQLARAIQRAVDSEGASNLFRVTTYDRLADLFRPVDK
jgi:hypothetical protein